MNEPGFPIFTKKHLRKSLLFLHIQINSNLSLAVIKGNEGKIKFLKILFPLRLEARGS